MSVTGIHDVRQALLSAKDLSRIADAFFSWFESSGGAGTGDPVDPAPALVTTIVGAVAAGVLGRRVAIEQDFWFRLASERFVHGAFEVAGSFGQALYFEDLGMGLVTITPLGGMTHFARLMAVPAPPQDPTLN